MLLPGPKIREKRYWQLVRDAEVDRRRRENRGAAPMGCSVGRGVPLPTGGGVWGGGSAPSPEIFFRFCILKWRFLVPFLGTIFTVQLHVLHVKAVLWA